MSERFPIIVVDCREDHLHERDTERIVQVFGSAGYLCTKDQATQMWRYYSGTMAANWMILPDDDADILSTLTPYFQVDESQ